MKLYRKRLIPNEIRELKDDVIVYEDAEKVITSWTVLNPRTDFNHGMSCHYLKEGFKVSKFLREDDSMKCWYCDIIKTEKVDDGLVFVDLLADVVIEADGVVKVVDLDELADAYEQNLLTKEEMGMTLRQLDVLLKKIYSGEFDQCKKDLSR